MYQCTLHGIDSLSTAQVQSLTGAESLQEAFTYSILVSDFQSDIRSLLGQDISVHLEPENGTQEPFYIHGFIEHVQLQSAKNKTICIQVSPALKKLDHFRYSQIRHADNIQACIDSILRDHQFNNDDFSFELQYADKLPAFDCFVQYQESEYALLKRWCEWAGWSIHYQHDDKRCSMRICDSNQAYQAWPDGAINIVRRNDGDNDQLSLNDAKIRRQRRPAVLRTHNYDWRQPETDLHCEGSLDKAAGCVGTVQLAQQRYRDPEQGAYIARIRSEAIRLSSEQMQATLIHPQLRPGTIITIKGEKSLNKEWLVFRQELNFTRESDNTRSLQVKIQANPADIDWRPQARTEKPRISGGIHGHVSSQQDTAQTAMGRIDLDQYGRYAVSMPYTQNKDDNHVLHKRMRAVSMSAGAQAGCTQIYPVDTEVLVSHINGDADRPVILGSLSNRNNPSPVNSNNATESAWNSPSGHKMIFDDNADAPQMLKSDASGSNLEVYGTRKKQTQQSDSSFSDGFSFRSSAQFATSDVESNTNSDFSNFELSNFWDASDDVWPSGWSDSNKLTALHQHSDGSLKETLTEAEEDSGNYSDFESVYDLVKADLKKAYQSDKEYDVDKTTKHGQETHIPNAHTEADNFYGDGEDPTNIDGFLGRKKPLRVVGGDFVQMQYGTNYTWHEGDKVTWKHGNNVVINSGEPYTFDLYSNKAHVVNLGNDVTVTYDSGGPNWDETYSRNTMDVILQDREREDINKHWEFNFGIGKANLEVEVISAECRLGPNMSEMQFKLGGKWEYDLIFASLEFKLLKNDIYLIDKRSSPSPLEGAPRKPKMEDWVKYRIMYLDVGLLQTINALNRKAESKLMLSLYGACIRLIVADKLDFYFAPIIINNATTSLSSVSSTENKLFLFSLRTP